MATYHCCGPGCDQDMTAVVEAAFEGGDVIVEEIEEGDLIIARRQVQATCVNDHTCLYTESDG